MAEKDLLFGGDIGPAAPNYVKQGRGFDVIDMPDNLTYALGKSETFARPNRRGTPLKPTGEYPDQPVSWQAPGGSDDAAFRNLRRATGLPYPEWDGEDGGRDNGLRDLTDPKYRAKGKTNGY